jgi:hypothetical protein
MLEISYVPPSEYDLEVAITANGIPEFTMGLVAGNSQFTVVLDNRNGSRVHVKGDKPPEGSSFSGESMPEGKPNVILFAVRRTGVTVFSSGKNILRWTGNLSTLGMGRPEWKPKTPNALFIGYWRNFAGGGDYEITGLTLSPLTGKGQRIR